jgi:hypothetical protein
MYHDASRNPLTAMQMVDALLAPVQAGVAAGVFHPIPRFTYDTGVSLAVYERLQAQYDELLLSAEQHIRSLKHESTRKSLEIARLKLELARK